jgi:hypothetical protein
MEPPVLSQFTSIINNLGDFMITVKLTQKDGQTWQCYFDKRTQADAWVAEEQTRPYWPNYETCEITGEDTPDPVPPQEGGQ